MSEQVRNELVQPDALAQEELMQPETPTNGGNGSRDGAAVTLSPSVVRSAMWRHLITLQWSWNYERMQALGYLYSMLPVINAVYKDKAERIEAMKRHLVFYNHESAGRVAAHFRRDGGARSAAAG